MSNPVEYSLPHAPHVKGTWLPRVWDPVEGKHEPQVVNLRCDICGDTHRVICEQGRPREKVAAYARDHFHGDALEPAKRGIV